MLADGGVCCIDVARRKRFGQYGDTGGQCSDAGSWNEEPEWPLHGALDLV